LDLRARAIKVELLWTKKCPFSCSFCGMVQNERSKEEQWNEEIKERWRKGFENLKNIGVKFIAIYGAEPLTRMKGLDEVIKLQRELGLEQTIITALNQPNKIKKLEEAGLNSLSVSFDVKNLDDDRNIKTQNGVKLLEEFPEIDDKACIVTVMKENEDYLIEGVKQVLDKGYWLMFDLVHPGYSGVDEKTGYPLSKCIGDDYSADVDKVVNFINTLIEWKKEGKKIHASIKLLEDIRDGYVKVKGKVRDLWHCNQMTALGFLTVGPMLQVYFCDDCQLEYKYPLDEMDTEEKWIEFFEWRKEQSTKKCPGCSWNTHYNTEEIVTSGNSGTYIHNKLYEDLGE